MTVIDIAGAQTGGAARFRREAQRWIVDQQNPDVHLIGLGESAEPLWLMRRELIRRKERRIATNNVSFLAGRGRRVVLLRNALHFLRPREAGALVAMPTGVRHQIPIIRAAALRADVIVVPCSDMADRVVRVLPRVAHRVVVRHHPLSVSIQATKVHRQVAEPYVLYPSLPASHKDLIGSLRQLTEAITYASVPIRVKATCTFKDLEPIRDRGLIDAVGAKSLDEMDVIWAGASAVFAPSTVESFGYPVAESRAIGVPVIAADTAQNHEIAGKALMPFMPNNIQSLACALSHAVDSDIVPDPEPFEPDSYFRWLTSL